MGSFCNPDKPLRKIKKRKYDKYRGSGKNAGHRHRGKPMMASGMLDWQANGTAITVNRNIEHEIGKSSDEMWDTHGYIQNWYNPCTKESYAVSQTYCAPVIDACNDTHVDFGSNGLSFRETLRTTVPFLSAAQMDELSVRTVEKLSQVVDSETSLLNFIIELIQACTFNVKSIEKFSSIYKRAMKLFHETLERLRKTRPDLTEKARWWLAWNFAVKPTISDLRAILCSVEAMHKKLRWLVKNNRKVVYLDYHRKDLVPDGIDPTEWVEGTWLASVIDANVSCLGPPGLEEYPNGSFHQYVRYTDYQLAYHARSKIFLDIPEEYLKGMKGMGTLWEAMMGLHNPVGIAWEATPFSWLIDYFLSYRARLFQRLYDFNPYNQGVEVLEMGHSFTITCKGEAKHGCRIPSGAVVDHTGNGGFEYSLYWRRTGVPESSEHTLFRVPGSWYQFSIIGALLIGFIPKRRR